MNAPTLPSPQRLAYVSRARLAFSELAPLFRASRERNEHLGIGGLLLYDGGRFFGYLEGEAEALDALHRAIVADTRHEDPRLLMRGGLPKRRFDGWFVGYLYKPIFVGELDALWTGADPLGDLDLRLTRWLREGDVL